MARRRRNLTPAERAELWRRWKEGQSLSDIGRALGKHAATVYAIVVAQGGIAPAPRHRAPRVLSFVEREEISRAVSAGLSCRRIARALGRSPSTVSREIERNGGTERYRASAADVSGHLLKEVHAEYVQFAQANDEQPATARAISAELQRRGFTVPTRNGRVVHSASDSNTADLGCDSEAA